jgi:hypothetical protein
MTQPEHPLALLFPAMTPEEYADLRKGMREREAKGLPPLEHPLLLYEGNMLDGRHRYRALELGIEGNPPVEVFSREKRNPT